MPRFINSDYALMRHAKDDGASENYTVILPQSYIVLDRVVAKLAEEIKSRRMVEIYHSPLKRAWLTAKRVAQILRKHGFVASTAELSWLNCGEGINDTLIEALLPKDESTFVLLVGHQPDIAKYLGLEEERAHRLTNCSVRSADFSIKGH